MVFNLSVDRIAELGPPPPPDPSPLALRIEEFLFPTGPPTDSPVQAIESTEVTKSVPTEQTLAISSPSKPLETFVLYPKLPIELRQKIMKHHYPGPRTVVIRVVQNNVARWAGKGRTGYAYPGWEPFMFARQARIPSVLHINKETRNDAKKTYTLLFEHCLEGKPVYFDFDQDVLVFLPGYSSLTNRRSSDWHDPIARFGFKATLPPDAEHEDVDEAGTNRMEEIQEVGQKLKFLALHTDNGLPEDRQGSLLYEATNLEGFYTPHVGQYWFEQRYCYYDSYGFKLPKNTLLRSHQDLDDMVERTRQPEYMVPVKKWEDHLDSTPKLEKSAFVLLEQQAQVEAEASTE